MLPIGLITLIQIVICCIVYLYVKYYFAVSPNPSIDDDNEEDEQEIGTENLESEPPDSSSGRNTFELEINGKIIKVHRKPETPQNSEPIITNVSRKSLPQGRRASIAFKPQTGLPNFWNILKNNIGKDLTKISLPVNYLEPISMLQRISEDFEYSELLDYAATCQNPSEQLAYVAVFTISGNSTHAVRTLKPFNPLLGETYEWDRREDLGWRLIIEQISHNPPKAASYCEGKSWKCWQNLSAKAKFRGKYLEITPIGITLVEFPNGRKYSWNKVVTIVNNIVVGSLYIDKCGTVIISGHGEAANFTCNLKYTPYSYFAESDYKRTYGIVQDELGNPQWIIDGIWDDKVEIAPVKSAVGDGGGNRIQIEAGDMILAWKCYKEIKTYYNFTTFACQLNELDDSVAPTDSRLRPDQRLMEEGFWDRANEEKKKLEQKQRNTINNFTEEYKPLWFELVYDSDIGDNFYKYIVKDGYWECKQKQNWAMCPQIFSHT